MNYFVFFLLFIIFNIVLAKNSEEPLELDNGMFLLKFS